MIKWIHHLLNPHCAECKIDHECKTCDTLRQLLADERRVNKELLEKLLPAEKVIDTNVEVPKPINRVVSWRVKQQMLEQEDRKKAQLMKEIEEQEKELGLAEDNG